MCDALNPSRAECREIVADARDRLATMPTEARDAWIRRKARLSLLDYEWPHEPESPGSHAAKHRTAVAIAMLGEPAVELCTQAFEKFGADLAPLKRARPPAPVDTRFARASPERRFYAYLARHQIPREGAYTAIRDAAWFCVSCDLGLSEDAFVTAILHERPDWREAEARRLWRSASRKAS